MNVTLQFLGGIIIAIITGIATVYGSRALTKSSLKAQEAQLQVDQRKVDQAAFDKFVGQYEKEYQRLTHQIDQYSGWLATTLTHLRKMNRFWEDVLPSLPLDIRRRYPRVPVEIARLPQWYYDEEDSIDEANE